MTQAEVLSKELDNRANEKATIQKLWNSLLPHCPTDFQTNFWLALHTFPIVVHGVRETAWKFNRLRGQMSDEYMTRFASKCMNVKSRSERTAKI